METCELVGGGEARTSLLSAYQQNIRRFKMNTNTSLLQAALDYRDKGYSVIPIRKDKKPFIRWEEYQKKRPPKIRITGWWSKWPDANIGIITGSISDLDVIDVDSEEGLIALKEIIPSDLPIATAKTPKGWHYYFKHIEGVGNKTRFIKDCDVRGEGGYIIAPPSINEEGEQYIWLPNLAIDDVGTYASPTLLLDTVKTISEPSKFSQQLDLKKILSSLPDGERHVELFRYAVRLHNKRLLYEEARELVFKAGVACDPPLKDEDIQQQLDSAWNYPLGDGNLPIINVTERDLKGIAPQIWDVLIAENDPPIIFSHVKGLVRLKHKAGDHELATQELKEEHLRHRLARIAYWVVERHEGVLKRVVPPPPVVTDMLVEPEPPIPYLDRIIEFPIYAKDRTIHYHPGYSESTHCYYNPDPRLVIPEVSENPSKSELDKAVNLLSEAFHDFPFISNSERAHAIALMILPFVRELIDGHTPLHLIEAPLPGSGKTLLADVAAFPSLGRSIAKMAESEKSDGDYKKRITALLIEGPTFICIDNIRARLESSAISLAITCGIWKDRILQVSKNATVRVKSVWIATGNNPALSSEVTRRTIRIRIDPKMDKPWLREGHKYFKHPDILEWMKRHRGEFIHGILTIVNKWIAEGEPSPPKTTPVLGMFEEWRRVMGGFL